MEELSDFELFQKVKTYLQPEPPFSLIYEVKNSFTGTCSAGRLAKYLANWHMEYTYIDPRKRVEFQKKELQRQVIPFFLNSPSVAVVNEIADKHPELRSDLNQFSRKISTAYPKYKLRPEGKPRTANKSKKGKLANRKKIEQKYATKTPKSYTKIVGHPRNFWVIAWKGWSRSYVVNPRSLYSGLPKKYKIEQEAIDDCLVAKCVLLQPAEYDKIAPKVPQTLLWALERGNQRQKGSSIYKHGKLIDHVALILPKDSKGNVKVAKSFLKDIESIFPGVKELPNVVIIKAILIIKRRGLTAEKTAKELRQMKYGYKGQPSYMRIIYTPM